MSYTKPGSPFLYDEVTNDVVGFKDGRDGSESSVSGAGKVVAKGRVSQIGHSFPSNGYVGSQVTSLNSLAWASAVLPVPLDLVANYGVAGATIADVISGQLASILADTSAIAHVDIGINDVARNSGTSADLTAWTTHVGTLSAALCAGKPGVIWCGIDPASPTFAPCAAEARNFNAVTAQALAQYSNALFVSMDAALQDPAASPFSLTPLASLLFDGIAHPNTAGAYRRGITIAAAVRDRMRITNGYTVARSTSLPAFGTSTGTATPNSGVITQTNPIPAGYTLTINPTGSANIAVVVTTANPTSGPKRVRLTITATGAGSINFTNTSTNLTGSIFIDEIMRAQATVAVLSQTALVEGSLLLNRNGQLVSANAYSSAIETPTAGWPAEAHTATWRTKPTVATGGAAATSISMTWRFSGAGAAVIDIYEGIKVEALTVA